MVGDSLSLCEGYSVKPLPHTNAWVHSDKVEIKPVFWEPGLSTTGFPKTPWKPLPLEREIIWFKEAF